jgi:hypothetical protein
MTAFGSYHDDDVAAGPTRVELSFKGFQRTARFEEEYLMDSYAEWKNELPF